MKKGETKADTFSRVGSYVDSRLAGANKEDSAVMAGYEPATARTPSLIENTKTYALIVQRILMNTATVIEMATQHSKEEMENSEPNVPKALQWANLALIHAKTADILTPKITVKETKDANGNVTRQSWGTNGAVVGDSE